LFCIKGGSILVLRRVFDPLEALKRIARRARIARYDICFMINARTGGRPGSWMVRSTQVRPQLVHGSDICITGNSGSGNMFLNLADCDRVLIEANRFDSPVSYWVYSINNVHNVFVHANVVSGHVRYGHVYRQDDAADVIFDSNQL